MSDPLGRARLQDALERFGGQPACAALPVTPLDMRKEGDRWITEAAELHVIGLFRPWFLSQTKAPSVVISQTDAHPAYEGGRWGTRPQATPYLSNSVFQAVWDSLPDSFRNPFPEARLKKYERDRDAGTLTRSDVLSLWDSQGLQRKPDALGISVGQDPGVLELLEVTTVGCAAETEKEVASKLHQLKNAAINAEKRIGAVRNQGRTLDAQASRFEVRASKFQPQRRAQRYCPIDYDLDPYRPSQVTRVKFICLEPTFTTYGQAPSGIVLYHVHDVHVADVLPPELLGRIRETSAQWKRDLDALHLTKTVEDWVAEQRAEKRSPQHELQKYGPRYALIATVGALVLLTVGEEVIVAARARSAAALARAAASRPRVMSVEMVDKGYRVAPGLRVNTTHGEQVYDSVEEAVSVWEEQVARFLGQ